MTDAHTPWTEKYRPTTFSDLQGNNAAIDRLKDFASSFPADRTPQLLVGDPGVGKSTAVEVIAGWLDLQAVELNASSARRKRDVERMAQQIRGLGADGELRVILLDEVDSWHHATNLQPLYDALDDPSNPVFLTANDKWDVPDGIVRRSNQESFTLQRRSIRAKLKKIAEAEDLDLDDAVLERLSDRSNLRSAINDLQIYARLDDVPDDARESGIDEMTMIDRVLTGTPDRGGHDPSWALLWLDENVRREYRGLELAYAYEALSLADVALGRAREKGYYHWKYAGRLVEAVARLRRTEPYYDDEISWKKKEFPQWLKASEEKATDGSSEATLYRELSHYEAGWYGIGASYREFRTAVLPVLRDLDEEERFDLILQHGLSEETFDALGVTAAAYESWLEVQAPAQGEWGGATQAADQW